MATKKPIEIIIAKGKHKSQPYTVTINPPGKAESTTLKQRYKSAFTARRGGLRHLKATTYMGMHPDLVSASPFIGYVTPYGREIVIKSAS